jgi:hypothetical protein
MNTLKDLFKQITSGLITSMMITTMVLIPFPSNMSMSYAADETAEVDCEENVNEDGSAGVYKPGCDFNKALTKVNEDKYGGGVAGIIEQFIGAAFALAATSAVTFAYTPRSTTDCPSNKNPDITIRIMQLGSVAYLIGELQAKNEYTKASKLATDNRFAIQEKKDELVEDKKEAKKNKDGNNKQLEAYGTLMDIMDRQIDALDKKINMSMVAEAAYLTAMGTEIGLIMGHYATCEGSRVSVETADQVSGVLEFIGGAATESGACADVGAAVASNVVANTSCTSVTLGVSSADTAATLAEDAKEAGMIANIFNGLISAFTLGLSSFMTDFPTISAEMQAAVDAAKAAKGAGIATTCELSSDAAKISTETVCAAQASKTLVGAACASACVAAFPEIANLIVANMTAIQCCGADVIGKKANKTTPVPFPSIMDKKTDIYIPPVAEVVNNKTNYDFEKAIVINTLYRSYFDIVKRDTKSLPAKKVRQLAALDEMIHYLDRNFVDLVIKSDELKKLRVQLKGGEFNLNDALANSINSFQNSILNEASAGGFSELLGFGVKLMAMEMFLGENMRGLFLPKPRNRVVTFLTMSALNGAILSFTKKAQKKAESRRDIIRIEAQRFADSHALRSDIEDRDDDGSKGKQNLKKGKMTPAQLGLAGFKTCAKPKKGGEFVPTLCPNIARRKHFAPPSFKTGGNTGMSPLFGQAAGLVTDVAFGAASGETYTDPAGMNESLTNLDNMRNALKKKNAYLMKKFDKYEKRLKGKKGGKRSASLSSSANVMRKLFSGGGGNSITPSQLDSVGSDLSKLNIEKLKIEKNTNVGKKVSIPSFEMPKAQKFDFDLGDSDTDSYDDGSSSEVAGKAEEDLSDFQVNNGEINENSDVNIFKLISNRYLRSYPILLEEVHTK